MAFKLLGTPSAIDESAIASTLGQMNRNTGAGLFDEGDFIDLKDGNKIIPIQIASQSWEQTDNNGNHVRDGKYPVLAVPAGRYHYAVGGNTNTEVVYVPLSNFCTRQAFNLDLNGNRVTIEGKFPQRYQYLEIYNGLKGLDKDHATLTCTTKKYKVPSMDGINAQERTLAAFK